MHTHSSTYYPNPNKPSSLLSAGHPMAATVMHKLAASKTQAPSLTLDLILQDLIPAVMTFPEDANSLTRRAQHLIELAMKEHFSLSWHQNAEIAANRIS